MVWKPKEKELTPAEALAKARQELAPRWLNSSPLVAGIRLPGGARFFPLQPEVLARRWLALIADPASYGFEDAYNRLGDYLARYGALNLSPLLVLVSAGGPRLLERASIERRLERLGYRDAAVVDLDGALELALLGAGAATPALVFLEAGAVELRFAGLPAMRDSELPIQRRLRRNDPGLPLPLLLPRDAQGTTDVRAIPLHFAADAAPPAGLRLSGDWNLADEKRLPRRGDCRLELEAESDSLGLIARSKPGTPEAARVIVEVNERPVPEPWRGEDLEQDDDGQTLALVRDARLYRLVRGLPPNKRRVTLKFVQPDQIPIEVYTLRLGSTEGTARTG
jgi:hypothetical protein